MNDEPDNYALRTGGALDVFDNVAKTNSAAFVGRDVGGYRITGLIAEGGMGHVYRAERVDGSFEREVAIKISPISALDRTALERFRREQEVLASLNHPNIAHLYDAQVTEEGWPYIVMEYVDGVSLTEHCRQSSHQQRIQMLIDVIDAAAYAHARLVVHRDIKPANILVDPEGQAKLLDFGIAKLLEEDGGDITRANPMTPRYASPEQLLRQPITVASDIYQLGLLIFEVISGKALHGDAALTELIQRAAAGESVSIAPASRAGLARELVLIIEQCLRADPEARYRDANSLKLDLQAHLEGFPVKAVGPNAAYRLRKFIRRNLAATIIAGAAALVLGGTTFWYVVEIARERDIAQQQTAMAEEAFEFLTSFFTAADPRVAQGEELTARELLDSGAVRIATELSGQPEIQQRLYNRIGQTYRVLGDLEQAKAYARKSQALIVQLYGEGSVENLSNLMTLGNVAVEQGNFETAARFFQQVIDTAATTAGDNDERAVKARNNLGLVLWNIGRIPEALATMEAVVDEKAELYGRGHASTIGSAAALSDFYNSAGRLNEAIELGRANLSIAEESLGPNHPNTLVQMANLGYALYHRDGLEEALPLLENQLTRMGIVFGKESFDYLRKKALVAAFRAEAGNLQGGITALADAMDKMAALRGADHPVVLLARMNYAGLLINSGELEQAKDILETLIPVHAEARGEDHPNTLGARLLYVRTLFELGDAAADGAANELLAHMRRSLGPEHYQSKELATLIAEASAGGATTGGITEQ